MKQSDYKTPCEIQVLAGGPGLRLIYALGTKGLCGPCEDKCDYGGICPKHESGEHSFNGEFGDYECRCGLYASSSIGKFITDRIIARGKSEDSSSKDR